MQSESSRLCACGCGEQTTRPEYQYRRGHRVGPRLCACGCGERVQPRTRYRLGHRPPKLCACGCGLPVAQRRCDYLNGHRPVAHRLWAKVRKTNACWLWEGTTTHDGYGLIFFEGRNQLTHRVSWQIANGPIPDGMSVCHRCDVPACVRVDHLFLADHAANMADRNRKGRGWWQKH